MKRIYVPLTRVTAWARGVFITSLPTLPFIPPACAFICKTMTANINNFGTINFYENNSEHSRTESSKQVEDIEPLSAANTTETEEVIHDSFIFTKKARNERKIPVIIHALQNSWQNDGYVDAHYNARVMYDELEKLTPLTFGYEAFKKYYNNTI